MDLDSFRLFCLSLPDTSESLPFDENTLVFKVAGKIFAICGIENFETVNLKCDPEQAITLREEYPEHVFPGYHMNKKHWNTVRVDQGLRSDLIRKWTQDSYDLVVQGLPKSKRPPIT